jgi:hypothetical protein
MYTERRDPQLEVHQNQETGKEDSEWAGDNRISYALNADMSVRNALLEEMQAKGIDNAYILEPEGNVAGIRMWPKEHLPSRRLPETVETMAGYLRKIA